jgi:predicted GNAT family acetyltransferase
VSTDSDDVQVTFDADADGYVLTVDGVRAGVAEVLRGDGVMIFTHTEVAPEFGGRGLAKALISRALADVAAQGLAVEARCHFVAAYLAKNPDAARLAG